MTKTTLRHLGAPGVKRTPAPERSKDATEHAAMARKILRQEFKRALDLKRKLVDEQAASGPAKGRDAKVAEKVRSIVGSLEGMSRFALAMGLVTPAENRAIFADAMKKGLYEGWR